MPGAFKAPDTPSARAVCVRQDPGEARTPAGVLYHWPAALSYTIRPFCPISADGLQLTAYSLQRAGIMALFAKTKPAYAMSSSAAN